MARFAIKLCADDYGLTPGVSDGILQALAKNRLTATCAMTNRPDWGRAARLFRELSPDAELGLHFNLTEGQPLTRMPDFAPSGPFPALNAVILRSLRGALPEGEIRAEFRAQMDAFETAAGFPPDFVDGHQHVHGFPWIRGWVASELTNRKLPAGFWLRNSSDSLANILRRRVEAPKALIVKSLTGGLRGLASREGLAMNDAFSGFSAFAVGRDYTADFASFLIAPGHRHLIMCHPGRCDDELRAIEPEAAACRETELDFLLSGRFDACLESAGAALEFPSKNRMDPVG